MVNERNSKVIILGSSKIWKINFEDIESEPMISHSLSFMKAGQEIQRVYNFEIQDFNKKVTDPPKINLLPANRIPKENRIERALNQSEDTENIEYNKNYMGWRRTQSNEQSHIQENRNEESVNFIAKILKVLNPLTWIK